ncbi:MAG: hypothetical protein DRJ96_02575 [Thermoprotei archaeon]|nr:MAG: hypothetical protein DRJ96_02575 [Thermoprotei archaeon]
MNSWERVCRAMELSIPDRVPIYEMHVPPAIASVILGKKPSEVLLHNPEAVFEMAASGRRIDVDSLNRRIADELVEVCERARIDWVRVVWGYARPPRRVRRLGDHVWEVDGAVYAWSGETLWRLDEPSSYDPDDVLRMCRESSVEVEDDVFDVLRHVVRRVKGLKFISFDADGTWGPIVSSPNLLRHVLRWMYTRPDVVEALIRRYTRWAVEVGRRAIDEGADAVQMCVDYGNKNGPWMSPAMFKRFIKPALREHVNAFKRRGAFVVLHSDGNIEPLLPDIVDAGVDAYQGIDVMAGMSLARVKELYGDELCLVGNVDPRVIEFGTREDVEREVDRCLAEGAQGGGYVLSTSANISANTNAQNFLHMIEYAVRRGTYNRLTP